MVAALGIGAALFQPWQIVVNRRLDDALPASVPSSAAPDSPSTSPAATAQATPKKTDSPSATASPPATAKPKSVVRRTGRLISHEHQTSGRASVVELADGRRVLRLEDLDTSSGPDLRVWLSEGPVVEGRAGWFVFGDHPYVELGRLKANQGNQNYEIPPDADLDRLRSVSIWCKRFRVSFGAAALA